MDQKRAQAAAVLAFTAAALLTSQVRAGDLLPAGPSVGIVDIDIVQRSNVASLPNNRLVVVFLDQDDFGDASLKARFFAADGQPEGAAIEIVSDASCPGLGNPRDLAVADDGSFVVVWYCVADGGAYVQRVDATGVPQGSPVLVDAANSLEPRSLRVRIGSGGLYVLWYTYFDLVARHYDTAGNPTAPAFSLYDIPTCCGFGVAFSADILPSGDLVASWLDSNSNPSIVATGRFASDGSAVTPSFQTNDAGVTFGRPHVVSESDGGYAVFWYIAAGDLLASRRYDQFDAASGSSTAIPIGAEGDIFGLVRSSAGYVFLSTITKPLFVNGVSMLYRLDASRQPIGAPLPALDDRRLIANDVTVDDGGNPIIAAYHPFYTVGTPDVFQRFCDSDDAACDRCGAFDDALDTDADGVPDGCDACTNVGGARAIEKPRVYVTSGTDVKPATFRIVAETTLPVPFSAIDPAADGVRVALVSATHGDIVDARIADATAAAGAWKLSGAKTWRFKGETDSSSSVGSGAWTITVKDRSAQAPGRVRVAAKHTGGDYYPIVEDAFDLPPRLVVNLGDESELESDRCGEALFVLDRCSWRDTSYPSFRCR
jgi:hypothetical protein